MNQPMFAFQQPFPQKMVWYLSFKAILGVELVEMNMFSFSTMATKTKAVLPRGTMVTPSATEALERGQTKYPQPTLDSPLMKKEILRQQ